MIPCCNPMVEESHQTIWDRKIYHWILAEDIILSSTDRISSLSLSKATAICKSYSNPRIVPIKVQGCHYKTLTDSIYSNNGYTCHKNWIISKGLHMMEVMFWLFPLLAHVLIVAGIMLPLDKNCLQLYPCTPILCLDDVDSNSLCDLHFYPYVLMVWQALLWIHMVQIATQPSSYRVYAGKVLKSHAALKNLVTPGRCDMSRNIFNLGILNSGAFIVGNNWWI